MPFCALYYADENNVFRCGNGKLRCFGGYEFGNKLVFCVMDKFEQICSFIGSASCQLSTVNMEFG